MGRDPKLLRAREAARAAGDAADTAVAEAPSDDERAGPTTVEADEGEEEEDDEGWEVDEDEEDAGEEGEEGEEAGGGDTRMVWRPSDGLREGEELEHDPSAYDCLHAFQLEWPCLSFDVLRDELGEGRTRFPHTAYLVAGSQADRAGGNSLTLARLTNVARTRRAHRAGSSDDDDDDDDDDDSSSSSDSEAEAAAAAAAAGGGGGGGSAAAAAPPSGRRRARPVLSARRLVHHGCVNRVRSQPQQPAVVATWSDAGHVQVWDLAPQLASLHGDAGGGGGGGAHQPRRGGGGGAGAGGGGGLSAAAAAAAPGRAPPRQAFAGHGCEGYALAWSPACAGRLASGDSGGGLHVWEPGPAGRWAVGGAPRRGHGAAGVEDVAWSPVEGAVLASCGGDGGLCVWDARRPAAAGPALRRPRAHPCDANALAWNALAPAMLASGGEDGCFKVWDLRTWGGGGGGAAGGGGGGGETAAPPVASFAYHTGAVVSLEWAPWDASTLASAGEDDATCVWDLAVERDAEEEAQALGAGALPPAELPPQLMFVHRGQGELKELHWHPHVPGMMVTTAGTGFNVWKPENQG